MQRAIANLERRSINLRTFGPTFKTLICPCAIGKRHVHTKLNMGTIPTLRNRGTRRVVRLEAGVGATYILSRRN